MSEYNSVDDDLLTDQLEGNVRFKETSNTMSKTLVRKGTTAPNKNGGFKRVFEETDMGKKLDSDIGKPTEDEGDDYMKDDLNEKQVFTGLLKEASST